MPLTPKEKLRLFIMAPNQRPLDFPAEVAWCNPRGSEANTSKQGMGVRFTEVSSHHRQVLRGIVEQLYKTKLAPTAEST
jgi:Tfp pilus assembly protein PilZ